MSAPQPQQPQQRCQNIVWHEGACARAQKEALLGQRGCLLWFTGLSGSGKSTVACTLEHALLARGVLTSLLDGDNIRHGLNSNLGFSAADRSENIRRIGEVAKLFVEAGVVTLASFISPYAADREAVRARLAPGDFIEVYMKIPLDICEQRDPKGLYKLARAGKIKGFTGIDDPYEEPVAPELVLEARSPSGALATPEAQAAVVLKYLEEVGYIRRPAPCPQPANNAVTAPPRAHWGQERVLVGASRGGGPLLECSSPAGSVPQAGRTGVALPSSVGPGLTVGRVQRKAREPPEGQLLRAGAGSQYSSSWRPSYDPGL